MHYYSQQPKYRNNPCVCQCMRGLKNVVHIYNKTSFIHKKEASLVAQMAKNLPVMRETQVLFGKIPWRRTWQPTPVFLPRESFGQRSMMGYSPWGRKSWTQLKWLSTQQHTHRSLILEVEVSPKKPREQLIQPKTDWSSPFHVVNDKTRLREETVLERNHS